jgi:hypothetical protein
MKLKLLLTINAVVGFVFAAGALIVPTTMLTMYAMNPNPDALLMIRYFGASLLALGVLSWLGRNITDASAKRAIVLTFLVFDIAGVIVSAVGTVTGVMSAFGWSVVVILLLLGLGFGYLYFVKPASP